MKKYPLNNFEHQLGGGIEAISAEKKKDRPMASIHLDLQIESLSANSKGLSFLHLRGLRQI